MKRIAGMAVFLLLLASLASSQVALAAPQLDITLRVDSVISYGFSYSLSWTSYSGAARYAVYWAPTDDVTRSASSRKISDAYQTRYATTADATVGYRYFRVYAYDSKGKLLAYSNVVGLAKYPSGAMVRMKQDWDLSASYPSKGLPTGYHVPTWFIEVTDEVRRAPCSTNFTCGELIFGSSSMQTQSAVVDPWMVSGIQQLRDSYGKPITIINGYRTPTYNKDLAKRNDAPVATYSRHMWGDALDLGFLAGGETMQERWDNTNQLFLNVFGSKLISTKRLSGKIYAEPISIAIHHYHIDWGNWRKSSQNW